MPATWPAQLQDLLNTEGFSYDIGTTTIRTEMDIGPAKVRRRMTKSVDNISAVIFVNESQYSDLYYFFDTTLNGGVGTFNFLHPITQATIEARFIEAPSYTPVGSGGIMFKASMKWEVMP